MYHSSHNRIFLLTNTIIPLYISIIITLTVHAQRYTAYQSIYSLFCKNNRRSMSQYLYAYFKIFRSFRSFICLTLLPPEHCDTLSSGDDAADAVDDVEDVDGIMSLWPAITVEDDNVLGAFKLLRPKLFSFASFSSTVMLSGLSMRW